MRQAKYARKVHWSRNTCAGANDDYAACQPFIIPRLWQPGSTKSEEVSTFGVHSIVGHAMEIIARHFERKLLYLLLLVQADGRNRHPRKRCTRGTLRGLVSNAKRANRTGYGPSCYSRVRRAAPP